MMPGKTTAPESNDFPSGGGSSQPAPSARSSQFLRVGAFVLAIVTSGLLGIVAARLPSELVMGSLFAAIGGYLVLRHPFAGLLLYTIIYMWRPGELYPDVAQLRLERLIGSLTLAAMIVGRFRAQGSFSLDRSRTSELVLLVGVFILISVPFSYWPSQAMTGLVDFLKLAVWYLMIIHLVTTPLRFRLFTSAFFGAICKLAFDSIRAYLTGHVRFAQGIDRLVGQNNAAGDPNHLAATCAAAIPVLLLLAAAGPLRSFRLIPAAGAALLAVTLSLTGSRSGFLALIAMVGYLWLRSRRKVLVGIAGLAVVVGGVLALPKQYQDRYSTITVEERDASSTARIEAWKKGLRMIADRPLTGVGVNCFSAANAMAYSPEGRRSWLESHSLYVQVPSEIGLIGALVFFAFIVEIFRSSGEASRLLTLHDRCYWFEKMVIRAVPAGLVALLVSGVFGHSFMRYTWYVYAALVVAVTRMLAMETERTGEKESKH